MSSKVISRLSQVTEKTARVRRYIATDRKGLLEQRLQALGTASDCDKSGRGMRKL